MRRVENELWVVEKNKDYWNKGLPYLDGIEFYNLVPFSPELGSGILSGRVDYGRVTDPVTFKKAQATKGMKVSSFNQSVIHATYTNTKKQPLADPRVRRAMHLALDRPTLIEAIKDVAPMQIGGFMYPFSDLATPKDGAGQALGYQDDPAAAEKEAKALMAAAGYKDGIKGLDYLVRDLASYHVWSQAIQAMLQQTLNITCNLRYVVESVWFDDIANGHFDLAIGAVVSTLLDPSDYFNAWYHTGGPQNYSSYSNPKVDALIEQIDREVDPAKRQALIRQTEAIFEQDPPLLPVAWEKIDDVWYDYVKGLRPDDYFGAYDVCRQDTFWLDKHMIEPNRNREANTTMNRHERPAVAAGPAVGSSRAAPPRWPRPTGCGRPIRWRRSPAEFDGSKFQLAAPEPNPKRGGVLRVGILNRLPHFDFHQSGTSAASARRAACTTT